jgi:uncharacterized protein YcfJ
MSEEYRTTGIHAYWIPDENLYRARMDRVQEQGSKAPRRRPGDRFILGGAATGIVIGIIIGSQTDSAGLIILSVLGGGIAGTIIGSLIAARINRHKKLEDFRHRNLKG